MTLTITDFVEQVNGLTVEDISEKNRKRINDALTDLTGGGEGGTAPPANSNAILVSKSLNGRAGYTTISDALSGSNGVNSPPTVGSGDTIFVEPGTYSESLDITTNGLTIQSTQGAGSTTIEADAQNDDNKAIRIDGVSGVTIDGFEITFKGNQSPNAEKYGVRVLAGSDDFTIRNSIVGGFSTSEDGRDGSGSNAEVDAVRAVGITVTGNQGGSGSTVKNPLIENVDFEDITCTGVTTFDSLDSDSKAKGIALNGDVRGAEILNSRFLRIGAASSDPPGAQISRPGNSAAGTDKPRGISITSGSANNNGPGSNTAPTNFVIDGNVFGGSSESGDEIVGVFGQPAIFIGGSGGMGPNHNLKNNDFYHPVDNLNGEEPLNLNGDNTFFDTGGTSQTPRLVPPDQDKDGGNLIDRGTTGRSDRYVGYNLSSST